MCPAEPDKALEHLNLVADRVVLRQIDDTDIPALIEYYRENGNYLKHNFGHPPKESLSPSFWERAVKDDHTALLEDRACRTVIELKDTKTIVGMANLSNFVRGYFQACYLGYHLGEKYQGNGYMTEALAKLIEFAFDTLHLHRIMANYVPWNRKSHAVLERLGFVVEGYAKRYLLVDGIWEDHVMTSLTNANWTQR